MTRCRLILLLAIGLVLGVCRRARADESSDREYAVKAAFICKFVQFVDWPNDTFRSPTDPLVIAVVGDDPFKGSLAAAAADASAGQRRLVVRRFASAAEIGACHVLFVPSSENSRLHEILAKVQDRPVLTIGETSGFPWAGGAMRFLLEDGRIRFEVNLDATEKARLQISSKLLKLAKIFRR